MECAATTATVTVSATKKRSPVRSNKATFTKDQVSHLELRCTRKMLDDDHDLWLDAVTTWTMAKIEGVLDAEPE